MAKEQRRYRRGVRRIEKGRDSEGIYGENCGRDMTRERRRFKKRDDKIYCI
jgi:hypothetical protein